MTETDGKIPPSPVVSVSGADGTRNTLEISPQNSSLPGAGLYDGRHTRTRQLIGDAALEKLRQARIAVVGLGGVGSFVVEALARAGVEQFLLIDSDRITESNINRQNLALYSTIGRYKTDVAAERIRDINPAARIITSTVFFSKETTGLVDFSACTYIADAIDSVTGKLLLAETGFRLGIPVISAMGTGNKMDATQFTVTDINNTNTCPLARVMRRELKKRGIPSLKVVFSREVPVVNPAFPVADKRVPASISYVPAVAGFVMAGAVIQDIIKPGEH